MIRVLLFEVAPFLFSLKPVRSVSAILAAVLACFGLFWAVSGMGSNSARREVEQRVEQVIHEKEQVRTRIQTNAVVTAKPPAEQAEELMRWSQ